MLSTLKALLARHLPWWMLLVLGVGCVAVGAVLTAEPFRSRSVLVWLVAVALFLTGLSELVTAAASPRAWLSRVIGLGWIAAGVVVVSWPEISVYGLAVVVGIALVVGGAVRIVTAVFWAGDERLILGIGGLTNMRQQPARSPSGTGRATFRETRNPADRHPTNLGTSTQVRPDRGAAEGSQSPNPGGGPKQRSHSHWRTVGPWRPP